MVMEMVKARLQVTAMASLEVVRWARLRPKIRSRRKRFAVSG
jgi:hypothetical protein